MNQPGHGLRWDQAGSRWWWSNPGATSVHAWSAESNATLTCKLPDGAGLLAHCTSGRLLLGLPKRLCLTEAPPMDRAAQHLRMRPLVPVDAAEPRTSISDGCTDRSGFLVFGTGNVGEDRRPIGSFYQFSRRHGLRRLALPAVAQASSICFSGDGKRMFFADAVQGRILQCDYDAGEGSVGAISVFAELEDGARPRGSVVDAEGCMWSAQSGQMVQYDRNGRALRKLAIDCRAPAFGGPQLSQMMAAGEQGLVAVRGVLAAGQPEALFDDHELIYK